jgi:hypothetical protein
MNQEKTIQSIFIILHIGLAGCIVAGLQGLLASAMT